MNTILVKFNDLSLYNNKLIVHEGIQKSVFTPFIVIEADKQIIVKVTDFYEYWCTNCRSDHSSFYCKHEMAVEEYILAKINIENNNV